MQPSNGRVLPGITTSSPLLVMVIANTPADRCLRCGMACWLPDCIATLRFTRWLPRASDCRRGTSHPYAERVR